MQGAFSTGLIPLTQLGAGTYQGFTGGLYPSGSSTDRLRMNLPDFLQSYLIRPRDAKGLPKPNGKIVLLSIGMSNTTQEYSTFPHDGKCRSVEKRKSNVIVDGAQGGMSADRIYDLNTSNRSTVLADGRAETRAIRRNRQQVQAVWLKQADANPLLTFPEDAQRLKNELVAISQILKQKYPNLRAIYFSSRIYGGYADSQPTRGEPVSYQTGFAVKWLIEEQINGSPELNFDRRSGEVKSAWLAWGPYIWADGTTPRNDGLFYLCSDYQSDGIHPAPRGA